MQVKFGDNCWETAENGLHHCKANLHIELEHLDVSGSQKEDVLRFYTLELVKTLPTRPLKATRACTGLSFKQYSDLTVVGLDSRESNGGWEGR
jgi:hypothetical protein